jgi:hypothetical protein
LFKIITDSDGTVVMAGLLESSDNKYFRLNVTVSNYTPTTFDVMPSDFIVETIGHKPKTLDPIAPESIAKSIERHAEWQNYLSSLGAAMARDTSTTRTRTNTSSTGTVSARSSDGIYATGTYSGTSAGTSTSTTTTPDYAAMAQAQQQNDQRNAKVEAAIAQMLQTALRANTLDPGESVGGYVYFKSATADALRPRIVIAGKVYEFEF